MKRKIETTRINQKHHENSVGNIVIGDSDNYMDIHARHYISIDIGKKNYVVCISNNEGLIIYKTKHKQRGRRHDYGIYKKNHPDLPKDVMSIYDLGFL